MFFSHRMFTWTRNSSRDQVQAQDKAGVQMPYLIKQSQGDTLVLDLSFLWYIQIASVKDVRSNVYDWTGVLTFFRNNYTVSLKIYFIR